MGTKLQHAVNLLPAPPNKKVEAVDISRDFTHSWASSSEGYLKQNIGTGFHQLEGSMDRLLEQYNRESIRKTMLKQEEAFREQVQEMHRLYRVQKVLMSELRSKELKLSGLSSPRPGALHGESDYRDMRSGFWSTSTSPQASSSAFSNTQHSYNFHQRYINISADPSSQEPSSSSQETSRGRRGFDLERPAEQDNSACPSTEEDQSIVFGRNLRENTVRCEGLQGRPPFCPEEESEVELTLSIGCGTTKNKSDEKKKAKSSPTAVRSDRVEENEESLKRPHWLFRTLSLNRT